MKKNKDDINDDFVKLRYSGGLLRGFLTEAFIELPTLGYCRVDPKNKDYLIFDSHPYPKPGAFNKMIEEHNKILPVEQYFEQYEKNRTENDRRTKKLISIAFISAWIFLIAFWTPVLLKTKAPKETPKKVTPSVTKGEILPA